MTPAAITFGISASHTRVVEPEPGDGFNPNGCPASVQPGAHTGAFEAILTPPGDGLQYQPLHDGMTLGAPAQVRRGEIATYSDTFTNTSLNTYPLVDDCPLYRESLGATESGTLLLNCNGSNGILVGSGESIRFEMKLAVPADQPLGETTLRWQFIEPEEPALTAQVTVVNADSLGDVATVDGRADGAPPCALGTGQNVADIRHPGGAPLQATATFAQGVRWAICGADPSAASELLNLRSTDGGTTWTVTDTHFGMSPHHAGDHVDVRFGSATTGSVRLRSLVTASDDTYTTTDGGRTWTKHCSLPVGQPEC